MMRYFNRPVNVHTANKSLVKEQKKLAELNLNEIITVKFPTDQYIRTAQKKKQIVLHHTVSGQGVEGDISWWRQTASRIGTAIIIGWEGKIYQCFSTKYWAYHLGLKTSNNKKLNQESIGIEIDAWGGLVKSGDSWYPAKWDVVRKKMVANTRLGKVDNVQEYEEGYRGFYGYEKYTDAQIESLRKLLVFLGKKYSIPLDYNEEMWYLSSEALEGKSGVWTHTSFRSDKSDCHPDEGLVKMLKELTK